MKKTSRIYLNTKLSIESQMDLIRHHIVNLSENIIDSIDINYSDRKLVHKPDFDKTPEDFFIRDSYDAVPKEYCPNCGILRNKGPIASCINCNGHIFKVPKLKDKKHERRS